MSETPETAAAATTLDAAPPPGHPVVIEFDPLGDPQAAASCDCGERFIGNLAQVLDGHARHLRTVKVGDLHGNTDARRWAQAFILHNPHLSTGGVDEELLIGWFANAIESGRSAGLAQAAEAAEVAGQES